MDISTLVNLRVFCDFVMRLSLERLVLFLAHMHTFFKSKCYIKLGIKTKTVIKNRNEHTERTFCVFFILTISYLWYTFVDTYSVSHLYKQLMFYVGRLHCRCFLRYIFIQLSFTKPNIYVFFMLQIKVYMKVNKVFNIGY